MFGVAQVMTETSSRLRGSPLAISLWHGVLAEDALAVGQDEQPFPFVRCTDFLRREQACLNAVTQASKVIVDLLESQS